MTLTVNLISDLHLEFADLELPGGDVLILSGDVCEAKNIKQENYNPNMVVLPTERPDRRIDRFARFFNEECVKYRQVLYVMGNHEHYHFKFNNTYNYITDNIPSNVRLLEKETVEIDGVVFIGATLWTDLNGNDPITDYTLRTQMNDYKVITNHYKDRDSYFRLQPEVTYRDHQAAVKYIDDTVKLNYNKPCVVVTHHSPSRRSMKPMYEGDYHMNGGYSSNLEWLMEQNKNLRVWTHGHTHDFFDYTVEQCRVVCNPRGYAGYEQRSREFDPGFAFTINNQL